MSQFPAARGVMIPTRMSSASSASSLERWVPGVRAARGYRRSWLPKDLVAGIGGERVRLRGGQIVLCHRGTQ